MAFHSCGPRTRPNWTTVARDDPWGGWKPIETAPRDGTAVLVRCGNGLGSSHLASFVDGTWMEQSGAYVLPEEGKGSPTHWNPLATALERSSSAERGHRMRLGTRKLLRPVALNCGAADAPSCALATADHLSCPRRAKRLTSWDCRCVCVF